MITKALRTHHLLHRASVRFLVLIFVAARSLASSVPEDALVVVGAGASGSWVTEFTVSNAATSAVTWELSVRPTLLGPVCPICPYFHSGPFQPAATTTLLVETLALITQNRVTSLYLMPESGPATTLTVRVRVVNSSRPTQAIEVPAFRLSTIAALNPRMLTFPGAKRDAVSRTNLVLANIIPRPNQLEGSDVTLALEAYSTRGDLLGSGVVTLRFAETRFLVDVLAQLGVAALDLGQIRVTKVAGDGVFWGTMFTTTTDGGVSVSVGAHP